jgi:hypothetical protein
LSLETSGTLFAVSGAQKALASGLNPIMAALLGMLTGVGGGMVREMLVADIPTVLRADLRSRSDGPEAAARAQCRPSRMPIRLRQ